MMPVLDGLETLRRMRQSERTRHLPVVLMTALPGVMAHEVDGYELLRKPFDVHRLLAVVGRHVQH